MDRTAVEELVQILKSENVPQSDIHTLVQKYQSGEIFDCYKEEYKWIQPQVNEPDYKKTVYPDGSYIIVKAEKIAPRLDYQHEMSPMAIITKRGVKVSKFSPIVNASFKMDYERNPSTNKARILSQYEIYVSSRVSTYSDLESGYWHDWRSPTNAWIAFKITASNGMASNRAWLKGFVDGSGYWVDHKY